MVRLGSPTRAVAATTITTMTRCLESNENIRFQFKNNRKKLLKIWKSDGAVKTIFSHNERRLHFKKKSISGKCQRVPPGAAKINAAS